MLPSIWTTAIKILFDVPYLSCLLVYHLFKSIFRRLSPVHKNLNGETILITGAASGLGQQMCWKLAKLFPRAIFVLWDINEEGLDTTARKCQSEFGVRQLHIYRVDMSKREEVEKTAEVVRQDIGPVTVLINNAGIIQFKSFLDSSTSEEETIFKVNLLSYMWTIREFLPGMIHQGKGHIVCSCSGLSFFRWNQLTCYAASKYGLRGFLESLKLELRRHPDKPQIKISTIYPGFTNTGMISPIHWLPRYDIDGFKGMEVGHVAEQVVAGILRESEEIKVPPTVDLLGVLLRYFPSEFVDAWESHMFRNFTVDKTQFNDNAFQTS